MTFSCQLNGKPVTLPLSFHSSAKCKAVISNPIQNPLPALLNKMDRCKAFSEIHSETVLKDISEKLKKDCCYDSPNAFWIREK